MHVEASWSFYHAGDNPDDFWEHMRAFLDRAAWPDRRDIPTHCAGRLATAPEAVSHLLHRARYDLAASLARL